MFTIDTSVWVNADSPGEPGNAESRAFLDRVAAADVPVVVPTLLQVELAGVVSRNRRDPILGVDFADGVLALPFVNVVPLNDEIAVRATTLAAHQFLRGADAVYAAVAIEFGCDLVSLDNEHLTRLTGVVRTLTPAAALATLLPPP